MDQVAPAPGVTRRSVLGGLLAALAGVVAGLAGGCTGDRQPPSPGTGGKPKRDPDAGVRANAIADTQALAERYALTVRRHPALRARLASLRADHVAHLAALGGSPTATPAATPASPPPTPGATPAASPDVPADRAAALRALERDEQATAGRRIGQCVAAVDADLARLIASIGACEAAHAALLRSGAG